MSQLTEKQLSQLTDEEYRAEMRRRHEATEAVQVDAYMKRHFAAVVGEPDQPAPSCIATEAGTWAPPARDEREPDRDPDLHGGASEPAGSDDFQEQRAVERYLRLTMPGYTPQS